MDRLAEPIRGTLCYRLKHWSRCTNARINRPLQQRAFTRLSEGICGESERPDRRAPMAPLRDDRSLGFRLKRMLTNKDSATEANTSPEPPAGSQSSTVPPSRLGRASRTPSGGPRRSGRRPRIRSDRDRARRSCGCHPSALETMDCIASKQAAGRRAGPQTGLWLLLGDT